MRSNVIGDVNKKSTYIIKTDKNFLDLNKKKLNVKNTDSIVKKDNTEKRLKLEDVLDETKVKRFVPTEKINTVDKIDKLISNTR